MKLNKSEYLLWVFNKIYKTKNKHKSDFNVNYKCKVKNMPSKIYISNENVMIRWRHTREEFRIKDILKVKYRVKWWSIEVEIDTKLGIYKCQFPTIKKAKQCYEHLIYEKVRIQKY